MGIPFETLIIPSLIFIIAIIYLIQNINGRIKPKPHRAVYIGVVIVLFISSLRFIELMCYVASLTGIYHLPISNGNMGNVVIVEKFGGTSSFSMNTIEFKIDNSYNDMLKENSHCSVTYTPITHHVIQIVKIK